MTEHGVNVAVRLVEEDDWHKINEAVIPFESKHIGSGTGFGMRDHQFEAADMKEAEELAVKIRAALEEAGFKDQIDTCEPYQWDDDEPLLPLEVETKD